MGQLKMDNKLPQLTEKQVTTIREVITARTITAGLRKAGVSKTSFYDWLRQPHFKAEIERQRREVTKEAFDNLKAATSEAVVVLRELLKSFDESIRLRTAQTILESVLKAMEIEEVESRIIKLEATIRK
jgi:phage terminase small subunit